MSRHLLDFFPKTEIPQFLSDEESEHIITLAKESGLAMSIAGFDPAAYEGDLDEDMKEAGKTTYIVFGLINGLFMFFFYGDKVCFLSMYTPSELFWAYIFSYTFVLNVDFLTKIIRILSSRPLYFSYCSSIC